MLNQESIVDRRLLHRQGFSIGGISRQLGISRNTVRSCLHNIAKPLYDGLRSPRPAKLDAFKPYLDKRIAAAKPYWIPATVLFRELQTQGLTVKKYY